MPEARGQLWKAITDKVILCDACIRGQIIARQAEAQDMKGFPPNCMFKSKQLRKARIDDSIKYSCGAYVGWNEVNGQQLKIGTELNVFGPPIRIKVSEGMEFQTPSNVYNLQEKRAMILANKRGNPRKHHKNKNKPSKKKREKVLPKKAEPEIYIKEGVGSEDIL